jgi:AcrR family transcriptional regulator
VYADIWRKQVGKIIQSRSMRNIEHILEVAGRLLVEKGVRDTSLSDIAREAGISKGTLYY